jgi:hypothetical protein
LNPPIQKPPDGGFLKDWCLKFTPGGGIHVFHRAGIDYEGPAPEVRALLVF